MDTPKMSLNLKVQRGGRNSRKTSSQKPRRDLTGRRKLSTVSDVTESESDVWLQHPGASEQFHWRSGYGKKIKKWGKSMARCFFHRHCHHHHHHHQWKIIIFQTERLVERMSHLQPRGLECIWENRP